MTAHYYANFNSRIDINVKLTRHHMYVKEPWLSSGTALISGLLQMIYLTTKKNNEILLAYIVAAS